MSKTTQPTRTSKYLRPLMTKMGADVGIWAALQSEVVEAAPPSFLTVQQCEQWLQGYREAYISTVQDQIDTNALYLEDLKTRGRLFPDTCHESWKAACEYYENQILAWQERLPEGGYNPYTGVLSGVTLYDYENK